MSLSLSGMHVLIARAEQTFAKDVRVLVVEDDPSSRRALTMLLRLQGFGTVEVSTLAEAIDSLNTCPAYLLLDLMLPDGNGAAVLDHVRRHRLPIRVAVTSGAADWESMLCEGRPDAYFRKPLEFDKILRWLTSG